MEPAPLGGTGPNGRGGHGAETACAAWHAASRPSRRRRVVPIPPPLVRAPVEHREAQNEERRLAADPWQNEGWVSAQPNGKPTDPS
jgi:hypothetical protein